MRAFPVVIPASREHTTLMRPPFNDVPEGRRRNMAAIKGKDTKPEMAVRRGLHALGYRFTLHRRDLPGRPDLAFTARKVAVEVRGCFFHRHGCSNSVLPKSRGDWWRQKLDGNVARDRRNEAALGEMGWRLIVVWECEVRRDAKAAVSSLADALGPARSVLTRSRRNDADYDTPGSRVLGAEPTEE